MYGAGSTRYRPSSPGSARFLTLPPPCSQHREGRPRVLTFHFSISPSLLVLYCCAPPSSTSSSRISLSRFRDSVTLIHRLLGVELPRAQTLELVIAGSLTRASHIPFIYLVHTFPPSSGTRFYRLGASASLRHQAISPSDHRVPLLPCERKKA